MSIWELQEAFAELPNEDLWVRANPNLLSVGEIASHIAYWEASSFLTDPTSSELICDDSSYYSSNLEKPFTVSISAEETYKEIVRIHELCKAIVLQQNPTLDSINPAREPWTWLQTLQYQAFHIAYHTGQIYSVRHILGHKTVDN